VRALNLLAAEGKPATLTLVGSAQFDETDDELPSADFTVHRVGFTDPIPYLAAADLVVHASVSPEPLGQVVAQAAAVGAPIVCADRGGQTEWLRNGHSCLMVDPRNVSALAQVLDEALSDPSAARERARNASYAAEIFRRDRAYVAMRPWLETLVGTEAGGDLD
jgi:glycosyltransferase involved in cell wall biosynthesis